jgi:MSHA biogenesis protein MshJ
VNELWARYAAKLDAMTSRERVMVFAAGAVVIAFVVWLLALQPVWDRNHRLAAQAAAQRDNAVSLEAQKRELQARLTTSPDAEITRQIDEVDRQLASLDATLTQMQSGLIEAARMPALIKDMVGRAPRLQLLAMRTLPVTPLVDRSGGAAASEPAKAGDGGKSAGDAGIFKHGIEITVEGRYLDLLSYAAQLEAMPARLMWNRTRIDALEYPRVTMTLTLYTLSLDRTWLTI